MATTRTFKSGNSVAVRIPASFGIPAGTPVTLREEQGRFIVEPVEAVRKTLDVDRFWGKAANMIHVPAPRQDFEERPSARNPK